MFDRIAKKVGELHLGLGAKLSLVVALALFATSFFAVLISGYLMKKDFDERSESGSRIVGHYIDSNMSQYVEKITGAVEALNGDSELLRDVLSSLGAPEQRRINYFRFLSKVDELGKKYEVEQINVYLQPAATQKFILFGVIDTVYRHVFTFSPKKFAEEPMEIAMDEYGLLNLKDESIEDYKFRFPLEFNSEQKRMNIVKENNQLFLDINFPLVNQIYGREEESGGGFFKRGKVYGVLKLYKKLPATFIEELENRSDHTISFYSESGEFVAGKIKVDNITERKDAFLQMSNEGKEYINYPSTVLVQGEPFAKILVSFEQSLLSRKIFRAIFLILSATLVTSVVVLFFLSRYLQHHLVHPIEQMTEFSRRFIQGERSAWRGLPSLDEELLHEEVGALHQTFLLMGKEIDDTVSQLEQRVKEETDRFMIAKQATISLGSLVAGVAHDIASPSQLIKMEVHDAKPRVEQMKAKVDILFEGVDDPDMIVVRDFFYEHIEILLERLANVAMAIQRIVDIQSAIRNQARHDLKPEPVGLAGLIHETVIILQSKLRGLPLRQDCPDELLITCVRSQLGQVLTNLIGNAADALWGNDYHIVPHRPSIVVRALTKADGSGYIIEVEDDGPGIPESHKQKIFEGNFTTKATGEGTGLGVVLSRSIIEKHGGVLQLASPRELRGACFQIVWPIEQRVLEMVQSAA